MNKEFEKYSKPQTHSIKENIYLSTRHQNYLNNELYHSANELIQNAIPSVSTQSIDNITTLKHPPEGLETVLYPTRHKLSMSRGYSSEDDRYFFAVTNGDVSFSCSPKADEDCIGYWEAKKANDDSGKLITTDRLIAYLHAHLPVDKQSHLDTLLDQTTKNPVDKANELFDALSQIAPSRMDIDLYKAQDVLFHDAYGMIDHNIRAINEQDGSTFFEASADYELRVLKPHNHTVRYDLILQSPVALPGQVSVNKKYQYSLSVPNTIDPSKDERPYAAAGASFTSKQLDQDRLRRYARDDREKKEHFETYMHGLNVIKQAYLGPERSA